MIRFSTYLVAIVLAAYSLAVGNSIMVDPGVRDTIEIGCPEFSTRNDSIIMSVPISVWADEDITGFSVTLCPGMADTLFRFLMWKDASSELPFTKAAYFAEKPGFRYRSPIIACADVELMAQALSGTPDRTRLFGNILFSMPGLHLDSQSMASPNTARPEPFVGFLSFETHRMIVPVFINCDTVYHCLISEEIIGRFSAEPDSGYAPLTVQFRDLTLNKPSDWTPSWEFGDGDSVAAVDPIHTYANPGRYYPVVHYPGDDSSGLGIIRPIEVLDSTGRQ